MQTNGEVNIREGKGTNTKTITTLKKGVKLLRIEYAQKKENNYYWDKVVLSDGRKGYAIKGDQKVNVQFAIAMKKILY